MSLSNPRQCAVLGVLVLLIVLAGWVGTQYPKVAQVTIAPTSSTPAYWGYPCPTPIDWGYSVAPGWQMTSTPKPVQAVNAAMPPGTPTSVWMQPGEVGGCDRLKQIAEAAMNYRCEALWAAELLEPHVALGRQTEPGAQLTRIHMFGTSAGAYSFILFEQALIVWKANDPRILVASPVNGCWQGVGIPTPSR